MPPILSVPAQRADQRMPVLDAGDKTQCIPFQSLFDQVFDFTPLTPRELLHLQSGCRDCNAMLYELRTHDELTDDPDFADMDPVSAVSKLLERLKMP